MIFSCDKATLLNALNVVSKALPSKCVNPITEGILINASGEEVVLTATDNSLTIQTKMAAQIKEEGSVVLLGKFFFEIIRKMPDGMIEINGTSKGASVKGNYSNISISAFNADEYPELPIIDKENMFCLSQKDLKQMITQTMFATAVDESRPILTGCLFEAEENSINVVALDGYRLALRNAYIEEVENKIKAIIPARALSEITKIISDTDENVKIYIQKSYCMVELEETKIITRLIEGEFIKYKPIIPTQLESNIVIDRMDLLEAIDRAWLIVRENTRNNYVVFKFDNEKLIITSRSDTGNAYEEVNFSGNAQNIEIGFNPRYFVESLKNIDDEFIKFSFTTPSSPTVITPVDGNKYLYLILPVRL